jgi:hypothetical protein
MINIHPNVIITILGMATVAVVVIEVVIIDIMPIQMNTTKKTLDIMHNLTINNKCLHQKNLTNRHPIIIIIMDSIQVMD